MGKSVEKRVRTAALYRCDSCNTSRSHRFNSSAAARLAVTSCIYSLSSPGSFQQGSATADCRLLVATKEKSTVQCSCPNSRWREGHERVKQKPLGAAKGTVDAVLCALCFSPANVYKGLCRNLKQPDPSMELELRAWRRRCVWVRI